MTRTGRQLHDPETLPDIPRRLAPQASGETPETLRDLDLLETVDPRWLITLLVAWPVLLGISLLIEPAAADPEAIPGTVERTIATAFFLAATTVLIGAVERRRFTFAASTIAAATFLLAAIACPATGHHAIGGWWAVQMGAAGALLGGSAYGWRFAPRHGGRTGPREGRFLR